MHEFLITFTLNENTVKYKMPTGADKELPIFNAINLDIGVTGINDQFNGTMAFTGYYRFFSIQFTPNGFYRIFQIPAAVFTNELLHARSVFNKDVTTLHQQLQESKTVSGLVAYSEIF